MGPVRLILTGPLRRIVNHMARATARVNQSHTPGGHASIGFGEWKQDTLHFSAVDERVNLKMQGDQEFSTVGSLA